MRIIRLLKSILIPTLGISTIGTIAFVSTSCSCAIEFHVTSVELNETSATLFVGETYTLVATVLPENATDKSVTWSSSHPNIATVDQNGIVIAVRPGDATITVKTNDGNKTATCVVKVSERTIHVTSVELNETYSTLFVGEIETLKATVLPENATDKSVTWSSSHPNIATVDQNGIVTAVRPGDATITVKTNDGNKTATCAVSVTTPYVVVIANADSTLTLNNLGNSNPDLQYSTDGTSWSQYSSYLSINEGQTLYLKGNNPNGWSTSDSNKTYFSITGDVSISGNIMGLLDNGAKTGEEGDIIDIPCSYCFFDLFRNSTGITSVSGDFLPAESLTNRCYSYMFSGCKSLITAPELPATTLTNYCYAYMFQLCTSLITAPELPAESLAERCYAYMFMGCTSLKSAPELPATSLSVSCYNGIFFGCESLNWIKIGYEGNYDVNYFNSWVSGVASSGTFYYNGSQTPQDFQLPSGWNKY